MKNKRKKVITFPKNRACTPVKKAAKELEQLELLQKRLNIVIPLIEDAREFIFDYLKLYVTISIAMNGGAIIGLIGLSVDNYFKALAFFVSNLFILLFTVLFLLVRNIASACYYKNRFLYKNFNIIYIIHDVVSDSKSCNVILYISFFLHLIFFVKGSLIAFEIHKSITI